MSTIKNNMVVSTLECEGLTYIRRDGNTTRQIDFAIQKLMLGFTVYCRDHHRSLASDRMLFDRILGRLASEHWLDELIEKEVIEINKDKLTLKIKINE